MRGSTTSLARVALASWLAACGGFVDGDDATDAATDARHDATTDGGKTDAPLDTGHSDACPPDSVPCGALCVDLQTDPKNCGACGGDCEGTTCEAGQCTMVFVQGTIPITLAVDATNLYWTNGSTYPEHGMLMKVPKTGGQQPTPLAFNQYLPGGLAVSATDAYWSTNDADAAAIMTMPTLGGSPVVVAAGLLDAITRVAIDSRRAYWVSDYLTGLLATAPLDGGAATILASNQLSPHDLAIGATHLYWVVETAIRCTPLGGGTPEQVATARKPTALALDAAYVYWLELGTPAAQYLDGALVKMPLGGGATTILASGLRWASSLALDATYAWWTNGGTQSSGFTDGTVMRVPLAGGPVATLATKQTLCRGLVLDAKRAYWINDGSGVPGLIMRLTK